MSPFYAEAEDQFGALCDRSAIAEMNDAIAVGRQDEDYQNYAAAARRIVRGFSGRLARIAACMYVERVLRDLDRAGTREIERLTMRSRKREQVRREWQENRQSEPFHETDSQRKARERAEQRSAEINAMMRSAMEQISEAFEALEWRNELLASRFTLNDGTSVSWGEATVEQHQERIEMFLANASANAEGAARHKKAVDDILSNNVSRLGEIPGIGVAA